MQALSVSPIKGDCWSTPHFGSSYLSKPNWQLSNLFVFSSTNSREFRFRRHVKFHLHDDTLSNLISKRKRLFAVSSLVTLALDQQVNNFSQVDCIASDEGKDVGGIGSNAKGTRENGGESGMRIDVRALAETLHYAKTADDVEEVLCNQDELPLPVYSSMIRGFGIDKRMEAAMALFQWLKRKKNTTNGRIGPNLFIYNSLLGAMKQCKEFGELEKIMEDMSEEGVDSNIVTCNTLMAIHMERDEPRKSIAFLEEIRKKGLSPSPISYSTALLAYRKMEDGSGAQTC